MVAISDFFYDCDIMDTSDNFDTFLGPLSFSQQKNALFIVEMTVAVWEFTTGGAEGVMFHLVCVYNCRGVWL